MSGWGCPHDVNGTCTRLAGRPCDPGVKGCILHGRFRFSNEAKNRPPRPDKPGDEVTGAPATPTTEPG
ncbi:MAG: hypothetical protein ACM33T_08955 [Solirubrobacterales bacterium]